MSPTHRAFLWAPNLISSLSHPHYSLPHLVPSKWWMLRFVSLISLKKDLFPQLLGALRQPLAVSEERCPFQGNRHSMTDYCRSIKAWPFPPTWDNLGGPPQHQSSQGTGGGALLWDCIPTQLFLSTQSCFLSSLVRSKKSFLINVLSTNLPRVCFPGNQPRTTWKLYISQCTYLLFLLPSLEYKLHVVRNHAFWLLLHMLTRYCHLSIYLSMYMNINTNWRYLWKKLPELTTSEMVTGFGHGPTWEEDEHDLRRSPPPQNNFHPHNVEGPVS